MLFRQRLQRQLNPIRNPNIFRQRFERQSCITVSVANDAQSDILQALVALGYSDRDAALALKALPKDVGVSDGIKLALKALAK